MAYDDGFFLQACHRQLQQGHRSFGQLSRSQENHPAEKHPIGSGKCDKDISLNQLVAPFSGESDPDWNPIRNPLQLDGEAKVVCSYYTRSNRPFLWRFKDWGGSFQFII